MMALVPQCPYETAAGRCIYVEGHGGDHFISEDSRDHSDEIRIRVLRDALAVRETAISGLLGAIQNMERNDHAFRCCKYYNDICPEVHEPGCPRIMAQAILEGRLPPTFRELLAKIAELRNALERITDGAKNYRSGILELSDDLGVMKHIRIAEAALEGK